jgi:glycine C-acetyltransferase
MDKVNDIKESGLYKQERIINGLSRRKSVPPIVCASLKAFELLAESDDLRQSLRENTRFFREQMTQAGFDILPGEHPIVPVMFGEEAKAASFAEILLGKGVYVVAFSYPVVPKGKARIRTQISAGHQRRREIRSREVCRN